MAEIVQRPQVEVSAVISFNESELRALDALAGYGDEAFLKVFYEKLGKHYMTPHEAGLRLFFNSIREIVPGILGRADDARRVFTGERIAVNRPKWTPSGVIGRDEGIVAAFNPVKPVKWSGEKATKPHPASCVCDSCVNSQL